MRLQNQSELNSVVSVLARKHLRRMVQSLSIAKCAASEKKEKHVKENACCRCCDDSQNIWQTSSPLAWLQSTTIRIDSAAKNLNSSLLGDFTNKAEYSKAHSY